MKDEALSACTKQEVKSVKLIGAQNEVCDMAIKANAELEQINARLGSVAAHYEVLAARSDELKDEGLIQEQICNQMRRLCAAGAYDAAIRYSEAVDGEDRYQFISLINRKALFRGPLSDLEDDEIIDELLACIEEFEQEGSIPF